MVDFVIQTIMELFFFNFKTEIKRQTEEIKIEFSC